MFGGLAFLLRGHMTVVASSRGGVMLRADPSTTDELIKTTTARLAEMRGRSMSGWLYLDAVDIASDRQVTQWVDLAVQYTSTLPRKGEG